MAPETRDLLERAVGWFEPSPDPWRPERRAGQRARRRRSLAAVTALLVSLGPVGLLWSTVLDDRAEDSARRASDASRQEALVRVVAQIERLRLERALSAAQVAELRGRVVALDARLGRLERWRAAVNLTPEEAARFEARLQRLTARVAAAREAAFAAQAQLTSVEAMLAALRERYGALAEVVAGAPRAAELACEGAGSSTLGASRVAAQPDGVHVRAVNRSPEPVIVVGTPGLRKVVEPGGTVDLVWPQAVPGTSALGCRSKGPSATELMEPHALRILDPGRLHRTSEIRCEPGTVAMTADPFAGGAGDAREPLAIVHDLADGRTSGDVIRYAGYPDAAGDTVIISRRDRTLATFRFARGNRGGWLPTHIAICGGSGLTLRT